MDSKQEYKDAIEVSVIFHEGQRMFAVPKQPAPVAWNKPTDAMVEAATNEYDEWSKDNQGTTECIRAMLVKAMKATLPAQEFVCSTGLCHYKAQRQWAGLTDEEKANVVTHNAPSFFDIAAAIEAKLKEKNQ
jgi:hypothetical protein